MNTYLPKVSVIIPTYNRAHLIGRALRSVLSQTYEAIEVVVVDDASTDNTLDIIHGINDKRIIVVRQNIRQGAAVARNIGIRASSADYIAFQDSDDEWLSEKIDKQMAVILNSNETVGAVYSGFIRYENKSTKYFPSNKIKTKSGSILSSLLSGNFVAMPAVLVRRECLTKVGLFDENFKRLQDWELFIRLAEFYEFVCIDEPLLIAFHSQQSITADSSLFPVALKILLEKHRKLFLAYPKILAKHYFMLGFLNTRTGNLLSGINFFLKSISSLLCKKV